MGLQLWLVGLGGFFGALARYIVSRYFSAGTFIVNITGSFFMGLLFGCDWLSDSIRILVGTGFLGAYTTFSTFNFELLTLKGDKQKLTLFLYALGTYVLGILFAFLGYSIAANLR